MQLDQTLNLTRTLSQTNLISGWKYFLEEYLIHIIPIADKLVENKSNDIQILIRSTNEYVDEMIDTFAEDTLSDNQFITEYDSAYFQLMYQFKSEINEYLSEYPKYMKCSSVYNKLKQDNEVESNIGRFVIYQVTEMYIEILNFVNY